MLSEQPKRRRRDKRQKPANRLDIQPRDLDIVEAVYQNRVMSQQQIQRQFFGSATPANRRLALLFDHGLLERRFLPVLAGRSPTLYLLGKEGAALLRRELGYQNLIWYKSSTQVKPDFLAHTLAIVDARIVISQACQQHGLELEWMPETFFRVPGGHDFVAFRGERIGVIPDAFFCIRHGEQRSLFFLELDRGTTRLSRFRDKLETYILYRRSDEFIRRFDRFLNEEQKKKRQPSMRILVVVDTEGVSERAGKEHLANLVAQVEKVADSRRRFWFARLRDLTPENVLSQPIWQVRPDEPTATLLEEFQA